MIRNLISLFILILTSCLLQAEGSTAKAVPGRPEPQDFFAKMNEIESLEVLQEIDLKELKAAQKIQDVEKAKAFLRKQEESEAAND